MHRCPNCSYILTLLEKRSKYKCAKCGKLFSKKEIDNKEFRMWNLKEREQEKKEEIKRKKREYARVYYHKTKKTNNKPKEVKSREGINAEQYAKHKEKILAKASFRYKLNKEAILKRNRLWRVRNKEKEKLSKDRYRLKDLNKTRLNQRINDWRQAQSGLLVYVLGD